jgi:hypothetical protein
LRGRLGATFAHVTSVRAIVAFVLRALSRTAVRFLP